jgi:hypothetical protein
MRGGTGSVAASAIEAALPSQRATGAADGIEVHPYSWALRGTGGAAVASGTMLFASDVCTNILGLGDPVGFESLEEGRASQRKLASLSCLSPAMLRRVSAISAEGNRLPGRGRRPIWVKLADSQSPWNIRIRLSRLHRLWESNFCLPLLPDPHLDVTEYAAWSKSNWYPKRFQFVLTDMTAA